MYFFIVNPNARTGLGLKTWRQLEAVLKARNISYQVYLTRYPEHAAEFAQELTKDGQEVTLVVLGGDGTINEVINGIQDFSKVTLGYIPIGSSNDFARSMGLVKDPFKMLEQILSPKNFAYINIGRCMYGNTLRRFAVSSGFGFDAEVCFHNSSSGIKRFLNKLKLGKLSYTSVALYLILRLKLRPMTLILDGDRKLTFRRVFFAAAMNQRYEGGGFKFCPKADPSDDLLDIILIADMPKIKVLTLLPTAFKGWHTPFKGVHIFTCRQAELVSETALCIHTDGEPIIRNTSVSYALEPDKVRLICS